MRLVVGTLTLTLVYALALASFAPADLAVGALLGAGLSVWLRGRLGEAPAGRGAPAPGIGVRAVAFLGFAGRVVAEVVEGTWDVALRVVHIRPVDTPGIVVVPIGERTPRGVAVTALAFTLSPGSVLVDVDWERRVMLVHVIDASDPDAVRARLQRLYDRHQRRVFP